jgi:hypothetical protein
MPGSVELFEIDDVVQVVLKWVFASGSASGMSTSAPTYARIFRFEVLRESLRALSETDLNHL